MLVWLASYPRSGNTWLRILLNRCLGIETFSLYDDRFDIGANSALRRIVGHRIHGMDREEFCEHARNSSDTYFVKTHELPVDDARAVYIVRDGRAAVVSYQHYICDFGQKTVSLAQVIKGEVFGGSWSDHVEAWALKNRANTLLLRYKCLVADPMQSLQQIAEFLGLPSPRIGSVDFEHLHAAFPRFFRKGSNAANVAELGGDDLTLFWNLHGETMERMGYQRQCE
ncbi:MAG: sulfotransferase domain-containing protein [Rhizomicrobium sp.]